MIYKVTMSLFHTTDYKEVLRKKIEENPGERAYKSSLAAAAGCQLSFLSQVLHAEVQLTPDHAMGLAVHWGLNEDEREYFMGLVQHSRAGSKLLKSALEKKLDAIRARQENLSQRYKKPSLSPGERETLYYSAWHWSAIHILITIPRFQSASAIAERLSLPQSVVEQALITLESMGLALKRGKHWVASQADIHLPKESLLNSIHHANWRNRAISDSQTRSKESIHYTAIHSLSRADFEQVKGLILNLIDSTRKIVGPSKEEELISVCLDCFKV
ncbi:MAG: DUF4423 domain-containing protein [Deltaproteobacteria bacterium]|nr:DUF4423 domain-containing protein [Deltaproteobacteria bacterium]